MKTGQIIGYIGLAIISVLIIVVIILSFVPVKLAQSFDRPTGQIAVYKYEDSTLSVYNMTADDTSKQTDFNSVNNAFNDLGTFTVMQSLFYGLSGRQVEVNQSTSSQSINSLKQQTDGYYIEFMWTETQTLYNPDGSQYFNSNDRAVSYQRIGLFVDNSNEVQEYKVYIYSGRHGNASTSTTPSSYYNITIYANVIDLYNICVDFDQSNKISASITG